MAWSGASASTWLRVGWFPSTLVWFEQSWASKLAAKEATVFPTVMFCLASLPLTQGSSHKLDVVQRQMLRSIVGWVPIPDEPWDITMRRMNQRMEHTAALRPLPSWSNNVWQLKLFQTSFPGLLRPFNGCLSMIGCAIFHPHHPETEADRPKAGIRHSLCFHVNILVDEIG